MSRLTRIFVLAVLSLSGCGEAGKETAGSNPRTEPTIYTVNYPLKYFAERIGGDHVHVVFPAPPDEDPAYWRPPAEAVSAYQQADLILLNGASYAKWVGTVTLPAVKLVNTSQAIESQLIVAQDAVTHSHGAGEAHVHEGVAFTTWLDPALAIAQASAIRDAFVTSWPAHQDVFERNYESLRSDLEALDGRLERATRDAASQPIVFSHPVFQYLVRRYRLNAESVHWEPRSSPSSGAWRDFRRLVSSHSAQWMIWEGQPLPQSVQQLAALGVESVVFDPCGNTPDDGDWLQVMHRNADQLARVYGPLSSDRQD